MTQNSLVNSLRRQLADSCAREAVLLAECGELRALLVLSELARSNILGEAERAAATEQAPEPGTVVRHLTLVRSA